MGRTSCITSCLEHSVTKILTMQNASQALSGRLTVTFYYYRYPLDLSDRGLILTEEVISENKAQNISSREYAFLLSRKINWHGVRSASFNDYTEKLVTADVTKNLKNLHESRKSLLSRASSSKKVDEPSSASLIRSTYSTTKKPWHVNPSQKGKSSTKKEPIKTRQTVSSVGYAGVKWPEVNQNNKEKLIYKLHLAEERRLQLLRELKDEAVKKTKTLMKKTNDVFNKKKDNSDEKMLKAILKSKDNELKKLKENLVSFKMENILSSSVKKVPSKRPLSSSSVSSPVPRRTGLISRPTSRPKSASGIVIRTKEKTSLKNTIPPKDNDAYYSLLKSAGTADITNLWTTSEPTLSKLSKQSSKKKNDDDDSIETNKLINDLGKTMDLSELQQVPWKPTLSEKDQQESISWLKNATIAVNNLNTVVSEKRSISPWRELLNSSSKMPSNQINLDDFKDDSPVSNAFGTSSVSIKDIQNTMLNLDRKLAESDSPDQPSSASLLLKKLIENPKALDDMYDSDIDMDDIIPGKKFDFSKFDNNSVSTEDD